MGEYVVMEKLDKKKCQICGEKILDDNVLFCQKCLNKYNTNKNDWGNVIFLLVIFDLLNYNLYEILTEEEKQQLDKMLGVTKEDKEKALRRIKQCLK